VNRDAVLAEVLVCLDSSRRVTLVKAVGLLALAVALSIGFAIQPKRIMIHGIGVTGNQVFAGLLVLGTIGMTCTMFWRWSREAGARSPIYLALRDHPDDVVWIYTLAVHRAGVHYRTVVWFCLRNGVTGAISTAPKADPFVNAARALCPRATFGYTEENAARFNQNPASLSGSHVT
jgi:hypothetical protein